jgi:hypothetical protein
LATAPLALPGVIGVIGWRAWRSRAGGERLAPEHRLLLVIAVFGLVSIMRVFFNVSVSGPYTPFFVPTLVIIYLYLLFEVSPACFAPPGALRANVRRGAMALIMLTVAARGVNSAYQYRSRNTYEVSARRGRFFTTPALGPALAEAIRFAEEHTSPDDYLLSLPQGTGINFLAERRYPLREENIVPGFLTAEKEADAIGRIAARRVPLILVANLLTPEYRDRAFGVDYNQGLVRWIQQHYQLKATFCSSCEREPRLGDKEFFILAYERNP